MLFQTPSDYLWIRGHKSVTVGSVGYCRPQEEMVVANTALCLCPLGTAAQVSTGFPVLDGSARELLMESVDLH